MQKGVGSSQETGVKVAAEQTRGMVVRSSVKKMCPGCKVRCNSFGCNLRMDIGIQFGDGVQEVRRCRETLRRKSSFEVRWGDSHNAHELGHRSHRTDQEMTSVLQG